MVVQTRFFSCGFSIFHANSAHRPSSVRCVRYVCDREGSRAAAMEAEPSGVVPNERAEIQVRSDRATA